MITSRVKEVMKGQGITMRELVNRTGLSMQTINRARGDLIGRCTLDTLATISAALGTKVKDLFSED